MPISQADEILLDRIRGMISGKPGFSERSMFGGIAFFLRGNMCVGTWKGALVLRLDKKHHEQTQAEPHTAPMEITGRVMRGWTLVNPEGIEKDSELQKWLERATNFVSGLPAK